MHLIKLDKNILIHLYKLIFVVYHFQTSNNLVCVCFFFLHKIKKITYFLYKCFFFFLVEANILYALCQKYINIYKHTNFIIAIHLLFTCKLFEIPLLIQIESMQLSRKWSDLMVFIIIYLWTCIDYSKKSNSFCKEEILKFHSIMKPIFYLKYLYLNLCEMYAIH